MSWLAVDCRVERVIMAALVTLRIEWSNNLWERSAVIPNVPLVNDVSTGVVENPPEEYFCLSQSFLWFCSDTFLVCLAEVCLVTNFPWRELSKNWEGDGNREVVWSEGSMGVPRFIGEEMNADQGHVMQKCLALGEGAGAWARQDSQRPTANCWQPHKWLLSPVLANQKEW